MNMLSKPVERCRKTSYSLNLSLVLSALNALYKLLEIFCCILSLKKHLQAIHISVQSAHRTSLRRPAARTAARKSASSHALLVVRSSGGLSEEQVRELGGGGLYSAGRNVDRGMHDRQPRAVFASFTVDTLFFSTTSDPWTGPRRSARAARRSCAEPHAAASAGGRRSGRESWVHPRSVAEVEADRLHHLE